VRGKERDRRRVSTRCRLRRKPIPSPRRLELGHVLTVPQIPKTSCLRNHLEPNRQLVICLGATVTQRGTAMNKYNTEECLKRAAECARQAETANDPDLKLYLMKLASSWQAAAGETMERKLERV
jgi:hypothetical protein